MPMGFLHVKADLPLHQSKLPPKGTRWFAAAKTTQKDRCGDFAEAGIRISKSIQASLRNQSRPECSRVPHSSNHARGSGGKAVFAFNIHLPLSPSANSPLGSRGTRMPPVALLLSPRERRPSCGKQQKASPTDANADELFA